MDPNLHIAQFRDRRGRRFTSVAMLAIIVLLGAAAFGLFAFLEANAAYGTALDLEEKYICDPDDFDLEFPDLSRLSQVYTTDGVLLGELTERNSQPVAIAEVPDKVKYALLAAEDAEFYEHEGISFRSIMRAAVENARTDSFQGGSTITQQVVKKNFLTDEVTIERKICEAVVAAELERRYTKDQILEFYMNSVFYGANAYGVKAAADEYYGKELSEVTVAEAAAMVVPIRNPSFYDLRDRPESVIRARNAVIDQMVENEFITPLEGEAAKAEPLATIEHEEFEPVDPQVMIAAREDLLNDLRFGLGETFAERKQALFGCPASDTECEGGGGLTITVTVNHAWQEEATRILRTWFKDANGPTGAIAMVENDTGALRVMASGLEFGDDVDSGERLYDLATKGRRQAGSAFKPIALLAALENGSTQGWPITLGTYWDQSSPQEIDCGFPCSDRGNIWRVRNAGGGGSGITTLESATYNSINTVYAQVSLATGPENIVEMAHRIGIESPLSPVLSIALGTQTVSPFEMAAAYSTIANYGQRVEPYLIERIEDANGNVIYEHESEKEQVVDRALVAAVVRTLEKVVAFGTATRADIDRPQAGKTGTAQNFRDVWFMGFIPQYTTAVWSGYADAQVELVDFTVFNELTGQNQYYSRAFGGTLAAPIWKQFMQYITENLPVQDFPEEPDGTSAYFRVPLTEVPDVRGLSKKEAKDLIFKAGLFASIVDTASVEPAGTMLGQSPSPGTELSQGKTVTVRYSTGIPPAVPNLIGLERGGIDSAIAAHNQATGTSLTFTIFNQETEDQALWNIVIRTDPPPGAGISQDGVITVTVGVRPSGDDG
ncbi:MAG TPA: transglycosylase domain-containing protein [Acidimicrobiia bacterium]|jgi:penicillin-binding protein 1A|nr:transglycosylase domain-containing protein [Acidimicrobiia bacterium]